MSTLDKQERTNELLGELLQAVKGLGIPSPAAPTVAAEPEFEDIKIAALMSVPMCGWNPHWGCMSETLRPFNIPIRIGYGAFWHQTMSNLLEECIADGIDWALTFDYDSVTTPENLNNLMARFGQRPDIDALAALQCKRSTEELPLMTIAGEAGVEVTDQPIKCDTAHFGMTLIRLDALKGVPKPWFLSLPDEEGSYKTLRRIDGDIFFWQKWKKFGKTLFVDPMVSIGHLQPLVSEFDDDLKPVHTHYVDWRARTRQQRGAQ